MKLHDNMNKLFDLESSEPNQLPILPKEDLQKDDDFELARTTLRSLIVKNDDVLTDLVELAKNSEHPRAYEVAGQLIKAQSEIAKDLMTLHKQKKEVDGNAVAVGGPKTQNNFVFTGSTSDLLKIISQQRAKTIDAE